MEVIPLQLCRGSDRHAAAIADRANIGEVADELIGHYEEREPGPGVAFPFAHTRKYDEDRR